MPRVACRGALVVTDCAGCWGVAGNTVVEKLPLSQRSARVTLHSFQACEGAIESHMQCLSTTLSCHLNVRTCGSEAIMTPAFD